MVNLLVNALEVMPEGGRLGLAVRRQPGEAGGGPHVVLEVSDTGPGIPPADRGRIFEPFFTTKATGSGLGLAIVQRTVERHGGRISVVSEPGAARRFASFCAGRRPPRRGCGCRRRTGIFLASGFA